MKEVQFDYGKLRGRICEIAGTQEKFAKSIGISKTSLSQKLTNQKYFKQDEINRAINVLGIGHGEVTAYFFTQKI